MSRAASTPKPWMTALIRDAGFADSHAERDGDKWLGICSDYVALFKRSRDLNAFWAKLDDPTILGAILGGRLGYGSPESQLADAAQLLATSLSAQCDLIRYFIPKPPAKKKQKRGAR